MVWLIILIVVVVVLFALYYFSTYNRFINLKNGIESNLEQINVGLKKRLDLIAQVVESVKGQMKFEKGTLENITQMRSQINQATTPDKAQKINEVTNKFMSGLNVQVENYPNLKSNENVTQLINSINGLEEEISRLRYVYNNTVQEFNTKTQTIPSNLVAAISGFAKNKYLEFAEDKKTLEKAPKIDL